MLIYDWDMKIEKVEEDYKEYYTENKNYEVRNGKVVIDKDYANSNKKFSLEEFLNTWGGNWIITKIKVNGSWYKVEKED
jgi:hypothetical protein